MRVVKIMLGLYEEIIKEIEKTMSEVLNEIDYKNTSTSKTIGATIREKI